MTKEEVKKLAELAMLRLSDSELEKYQKDFDAILAYVDKIQSVKIGEDLKRMYFNENLMRDDEDFYPANYFTEVLLQEAPEREERYIRVKKVL